MAKKHAQIFYQLFLLLLTISIANFAYATPKNVIFMIGDGMGPEQVRAASFYESGEPNKISFQSFPFTGEVTTKSANNAVTDSAAAGTALATGNKVNNGVISMAIPGDNSEFKTMLEYFRDMGKLTGLVTTSYMTDATPAAFGAHETSRDNTSQIAADYRLQTKVNVLLGGGGNGMVPQNFIDANYIVVTDALGLMDVNTESTTWLCGQFGSGQMKYEADGIGDQPHLSDMALTALNILDGEPNGFFVMIESGNIDHAGHSSNLKQNVYETVEFDNTVQVVLDWLDKQKNKEDTLIIVTADHETGGLHVLTNNGVGELPTVSWTGGGNHTGANVPIYSLGENSFLVSGVMDNTDMYFVCTCTPGEGAWNPTPADGAINNDTKATLSWLASDDGVSYDIYFGKDFNDVNDANNSSTTFMSTQDGLSYVVGDLGSSYPVSLEPNTTYYWRVDEINDVNYVNTLDPNNILKGEVWAFTIPAEKAWNPNPADGAENLETDVELSWIPALGVIAQEPHHVYFGESYDEVLNGTGDTDKGLFAKANYDPGMLLPGKTYYWRIEEQIGQYRESYYVDGDVWSFTVSEEAKLSYELNVRVSSGADDAEEGPGTNGYYNDSSDLELLDDPDYNAGGKQTVGVHFRNINIPAGATITKAYVEFTCDETVGGTEPAYLLLSGNLSLAPESFGSGTSLISERPKTNAKISWQPEAWTSVGQTSQTTDISSIIQELINQEGWTSGNSIEIIISENTNSPQFSGVRIAESYDGSSSQAPLLHIEYELDEEPEPKLLVDVRISSGADDAEEGPGTNGYYNTSSDLELLDDPGYNAGGKQIVGVHFNNIAIPAGSTITNAYIEFTCKETTGGSEPAYLLLWGNLSLTPESFGSGTSLMSERPSTVSKVSWSPELWTSVGQTSQTSDISAIVQELINQDGWASGNSIEIIIGEDANMPAFTGVRVARSYDGSASLAPLLHIEFEPKKEDFVLDARVSAGADDAEEGPGTNGYYNTSSDLELLDDPGYNAGGKQIVGVHFKNIAIPAGAVVTNAYIEFTCKETTGGSQPAYLLLWGNLSLTPESFGSGTSLMSTRPSTVSKVSWSPESWTSVGQTSKTSDISGIIQELIDQNGWALGNSIEIIIGEDTSKPAFTGVRVARSYDGSASLAPLLHIEYQY